MYNEVEFLLFLLFQNIMNAMHKVIKGKTSIFIAHRLSTIVDADEILVLEGGRVIERGSHAQLISNPSSLYTDLWTKQHKVALESSNWRAIDQENTRLFVDEERRRERRRAEGEIIQESNRRD